MFECLNIFILHDTIKLYQSSHKYYVIYSRNFKK